MVAYITKNVLYTVGHENSPGVNMIFSWCKIIHIHIIHLIRYPVRFSRLMNPSLNKVFRL